MPGTLFIVATPIGNLEDISTRALRTLQEADIIACEDTRVTGKLLRAFGISARTLALHAHSADRDIARVVENLRSGQNVAYVSDAGTPGVNDPGGKLCAVAYAAGITVTPIPGSSALTAAISICGFPMEKFAYLGFAPHKKGRETFFREIATRREAVIFFESTHRISKTIETLKKYLHTERRVFIARELTKMHETLYRGTIDEIAAKMQASSLKGEFVIILAPV